MANMSYCRFHNTRSDLIVCLEVLDEGRYLSTDEASEGRQMFKNFLDFCQTNFIISGYDADEIKALFDNLIEKEDGGDE